MLWSFQYEVEYAAPEFNITNLFWNTEYCLSVEPRVASRPTRTVRTAEQCVTIGQRDRKYRGAREKGGQVGCRSSSASWPWRNKGLHQGSRSMPPLLCALRTLPHAAHPGMSTLAGTSELILGIVSSFFITVFLLSLLGCLLVCTYIKKPVRPPSVLVRQPGTLRGPHKGAGLGSCWERQAASRAHSFLLSPSQKSFIKQSSLWMEQESSSSSSRDTDPVQQLFLCPKEPRQDGPPNGSTGTAQLPLEKSWQLPAWPEDRICLMETGPTVSGDSSCTSTDSGICLQTSSSSELSCSSSLESQGYKRQLPAGDDSGVGLGTTCPRPTCPPSSGTSPAEARQPCGGELSISSGVSQDSQQDVEFRGYLQQSKGTVEPRQDPAKGVPFLGCAGSPQGPGSTDIVLDVECSKLAVAKGYLKQSSPEHPCSHAQDLAPWENPRDFPAWDFSSQLGPRAPALLSYGAPGAASASKAGPEFLRAPFDPSIFNTDLLGTLPFISSLSTN